MFCSKCGIQNGKNINFCRRCGSDLESASFTPGGHALQSRGGGLIKAESRDPDQLTADGIGKVFIGDGFFMVGILLSATASSVSSMLWLLLLIPAFFFFGKGLADVLHAKQIRRRLKQSEVSGAPGIAELHGSRDSFIDTIRKHASGELAHVPSVTDRTTRDLK